MTELLSGVTHGPVDEAPLLPCVIQLLHYVDEQRRVITEHVVASGTEPEGLCRFMGRVRLMIDAGDGAVPMSHEFPIEARSIEEAFLLFEGACNASVEGLKRQMQEEARKPQLLLPGQRGPAKPLGF